MTSASAAGPGIPTGNTYDKYGSTNPVVRRLMAGFERTLDELFSQAAPQSVLDVGCGEGVLTEQWAARLSAGSPGRVVGVDLEDPKLAAEWAGRQLPNLEFRPMPVERLQFADDAFELVAATEVLEHVASPDRALAEMARVAGRWLLVSVPHEPLWRALNMTRGAYLRQLGNTPGHLNHWTRRAFVSLLGGYGEVVETRSPFPWTMLLVRVGA
jgi:2-polyprenyl-3-methyl-5-hydroxy-6-metoxy-1,4-benzoquinol methylase